MGSSSQTFRRWFGGIFLVAALTMLIAGQTVLKDRFGPVGFVLFWCACLICTSAAIVMALLDLSAVRRRTRDEQRALFESTLQEIARQKELKRKPTTDEHG